MGFISLCIMLVYLTPPGQPNTMCIRRFAGHQADNMPVSRILYGVRDIMDLFVQLQILSPDAFEKDGIDEATVTATM